MRDTASQTIDVGTVLADTYQVTRLIGKGGMGAVWEAKHLRLMDKRVAIKVLHGEVARDAESVLRFRREANIASQLGHANIVQVFDIKELPDGSQYIVLEYLEGESLADRMARGPMSPEHAMPIVRQVASALQAAHHHGIVHRDLKPGNIMLVPTEFGGYATEQAKVLDFGISKMQGSSTIQTQTSMVLGTPQYMAPEQALGDHKNVDARTDIFALGCIVYEMLSGVVAFQGAAIPEVMFKLVYQEPPPLAELAPHVSAAIIAAVARAMAKKADERFADMSAFVEALTGDPLTTLRSGAAVAALPGKPLPPSMATGSPAYQRAHSEEAFASTMAPGSTLAQTSAATLAAPANAGIAASAAPTAHTPPRGHKRSIAPIIAVVAVAVAAAVAITLVVVKRSRGDGDAGAATTNVTTPATTTQPTPATGASGTAPATGASGTTPATGASGTAPATGASGTTPATAGKTGDTPETTGDKTGDKTGDTPKIPDKSDDKTDDKPDKTGDKLPAEAAEKLERAQELFQAGQYNDAIRMAKNSVGVQSSNRAWSLITRSYCAKHDLSNAKASARNVKGPERLRVVRYCKKSGTALR